MATKPDKQINAADKTFVTATISTEADGLSDAIDLGGGRLSSISMSTAWTAASMTFKGSAGSTSEMRSLYSSTGGEITYTVDASRIIPVEENFSGLRYLQLCSYTSTGAVVQAAARPIQLGLSKEK